MERALEHIRTRGGRDSKTSNVIYVTDGSTSYREAGILPLYRKRIGWRATLIASVADATGLIIYFSIASWILGITRT